MEESTKDMVDTLDLVPEVADMKIDLNKEEKLRSMSLMLGIRYYTDTIIKDAAYLQLMMQREKEAKFSNDPEDAVLWHLKPASVNGVIRCAQEFEQYLLGNRPGVVLQIKHEDGTVKTVEPDEPSRSAQDSTKTG